MKFVFSTILLFWFIQFARQRIFPFPNELKNRKRKDAEAEAEAGVDFCAEAKLVLRSDLLKNVSQNEFNHKAYGKRLASDNCVRYLSDWASRQWHLVGSAHYIDIYIRIKRKRERERGIYIVLFIAWYLAYKSISLPCFIADIWSGWVFLDIWPIYRCELRIYNDRCCHDWDDKSIKTSRTFVTFKNNSQIEFLDNILYQMDPVLD